MVLMAMLTALVVILTYAGNFIRLSPMVTVSLTLVPIVLGAVLCGVWGGTWLGLVNAIIILASGQAAVFFGISIIGTIVVVLTKGMLCGLSAALIYRLVNRWNKYAAVVTAAVICIRSSCGSGSSVPIEANVVLKLGADGNNIRLHLGIKAQNVHFRI